MRDGIGESPFQQLPLVVWAIALPMIAAEAVFGLGQLGFIDGGAGLRNAAIQKTAFIPELAERMWAVRGLSGGQIHRIVTYPFVHLNLTHALFVIVFTLALGNMVAQQFRPAALVALFFGSAIGGAIIYAIFAMLWNGPVSYTHLTLPTICRV